MGSLVISFFLHVIAMIWFCFLHNENILNILLYNDDSLSLLIQGGGLTRLNVLGFKFSIDMVGFIFIFIAYIVSIISFLALDSKLYWNNLRFIFTCNVLMLVIFLFTVVDDYLVFFLLYEGLLIPSFLFVYFVSPYRRGIQASLYFLIWTQIGSILVLAALSYLLWRTGGTNFNTVRDFTFTSEEIWFMYFLFFLGFGFKVPIWPFHYWLTKTHVEAPAGFSIFLSGFLVKSAVYGFYKLTNLLGGEINTVFFSVFCLMGVIDASMKMWGQVDLKKLVAFATIQEMNLAYLTFLFGDSYAMIGGVIFCLMHAFLSSLMFYLVDCIQKRYGTRLITEITGILHITPNLGISIIFMHIFFSGLPGTIKFIGELYIFGALFEFMPASVTIIIFIANYFGMLGFSKCWFNCIFGLTMKNQDKLPLDLNVIEICIITTCFLFLFGCGFFINLIV